MQVNNFFVCGPKFNFFHPIWDGLYVLFQFSVCRSVSEIFAIKVKSCQKLRQISHVFFCAPKFRGQASGGQNQIAIRFKSRFEAHCDSIQAQKIRFDWLRLEIWFDLLFLEIRRFDWTKVIWVRIAEFTRHCREQNGQICHAAYFLNPLHQVVHHCLCWSFAWARTTCSSWNQSDKTTQKLSGHHRWQKVTLSYLPVQKYLIAPATSAWVKRLFGVAGAIIKARHSSLAAATVESLLLHMQWTLMLNCLFSVCVYSTLHNDNAIDFTDCCSHKVT